MTWAKGVSGNPAGRRATAERIRAYLEGFDQTLIEKAKDMALSGDTQMMAALLARLSPVPKAIADLVEIDGLDEAAGLAAKADLVLNAVGRGQISPDTGTSLLAAIATVSKVVMDELLDERIATLERLSARGVA